MCTTSTDPEVKPACRNIITMWAIKELMLDSVLVVLSQNSWNNTNFHFMNSFKMPTLPNSVVVFSFLHLLVCHKPQSTSFQNASVYKGPSKYLLAYFLKTVYSWLEWTSALHIIFVMKESWIKSVHKKSSLKSSFKNIELFCIRSTFNALDIMILLSEFKWLTSLFLHIKQIHKIKKNG